VSVAIHLCPANGTDEPDRSADTANERCHTGRKDTEDEGVVIGGTVDERCHVGRKWPDEVSKKSKKEFMAIIVNLDIMMARRKISLGELAERIDITPANLSILKTGKAKAIRFSTLEAICKELDCQPGDILEYREEKP